MTDIFFQKQKKAKKYESQIDKIVYKLYGLTKKLKLLKTQEIKELGNQMINMTQPPRGGCFPLTRYFVGI